MTTTNFTAADSRQPTSLRKSKCNVFVGALTEAFTDDDLARVYEPYGRVLSAKVMRCVETGASRGFGFVLFQTNQAATTAIEATNNSFATDSVGRTTKLRVKFASDDGSAVIVEANTVYVRNIPVSASEQAVRQVFSAFGPILNLVLRLHAPTDNTVPHHHGMQTASRLAFVQYGTAAEAAAAVNAVHCSFVFGQSPNPVLAKLVKPKHPDLLCDEADTAVHPIAKRKKGSFQSTNGTPPVGYCMTTFPFASPPPLYTPPTLLHDGILSYQPIAIPSPTNFPQQIIVVVPPQWVPPHLQSG